MLNLLFLQLDFLPWRHYHMRLIQKTRFVLIEQAFVTFNNLSNVSNSSVVKESLKLVALGTVDKMFDHGLNDLLVLSLSKSLHSWSHNVELLL
jgi:hypothetical protein